MKEINLLIEVFGITKANSHSIFIIPKWREERVCCSYFYHFLLQVLFFCEKSSTTPYCIQFDLYFALMGDIRKASIIFMIRGKLYNFTFIFSNFYKSDMQTIYICPLRNNFQRYQINENHFDIPIFLNLDSYHNEMCGLCSLKHVLLSLSLSFNLFEAITLQRQIMSNDIPKL